MQSTSVAELLRPRDNDPPVPALVFKGDGSEVVNGKPPALITVPLLASDDDVALRLTSEPDTTTTIETTRLHADSPYTMLERRKLHFPPLESLVDETNEPADRTTTTTTATTTTTTLATNLTHHSSSHAPDTAKIKGDVRFLLDFAILGHAKCATSFIMKYLNAHDQVKIWDYEVCDLYFHRPASLVRKLYTDFPSDGQHLHWRGFKCPSHFSSRKALLYFRRYFRSTKLIIGLRHPVWWLESYYNFRHRHARRPGAVLPDATELAKHDPSDWCPPEAQGVCLAHAQFHHHLAMFGKTNLSGKDNHNVTTTITTTTTTTTTTTRTTTTTTLDDDNDASKSGDEDHRHGQGDEDNARQWRLLQGFSEKYRSASRIDNPIFLYDMQQLYDTDETRQAALRQDLQTFLGLPTPLPSLDDYNDTDTSGHKSAVRKETRINICDDRFLELRQALLEIGDRASQWILEYFLPEPDVFVSSRPFFEAALKEWKLDPCVNGQRTSIGAGAAAGMGAVVEDE